ncbi:MAG: LuxR C-terminal-related transcriptional regulator [Trebonia sp.]
MLSLARSLAILEHSSETSVAGRLAGLNNEATARALAALNRTGVLSDGRFRHPGLRAAVLDALTPYEQAAMHARAAACLQNEGAPAVEVARHLLAAEDSGTTWAIPVLNEAAEQALSHGRTSSALDYLKLAYRTSTSDSQRAAATAALARAEWRLDPAVSMRHYDVTLTTLRVSCFVEHDALAWVKRLMWFGRSTEARKLLGQIEDSSHSLDRSEIAQIPAIRLWLDTLFPFSGESPPLTCQSELAQVASVSASLMGQALSLLTSSLVGDTTQARATAEHVLQENRLEERTFVLLASALTNLIYSGRLEIAEYWCDSMQNAAIAQKALTWEAVLAAMRSMIAFRLGNLAGTEMWARKALTIIPAKSWGVGIGVPLSLLMQSSIEMGRDSEVLDHLRTPLPNEIFETPFGLHYLQVRGRFHYSRGNYGAAFRDFQLVRNLAVQWGIDFPALISWRTDIACALLRLGRNESARNVIAEQFGKLAPGQARERGISLRVMAACDDLAQRPRWLIRSSQELQRCKSKLELAYTLADLCRAYGDLGQTDHARHMGDQAYQIAKECGANLLCESIMPSTNEGSSARVDAINGIAAGSNRTILSKAEWRVAALAADGYSNREIAGRLFITVSTVEQHLTHVYSKLKVKHRTDLPDRIQDTKQ